MAGCTEKIDGWLIGWMDQGRKDGWLDEQKKHMDI